MLYNTHCYERGNDSVVECHLAKVKVAGPNPVSRSRRRKQAKQLAFLFSPTTSTKNPDVIMTSGFYFVIIKLSVT